MTSYLRVWLVGPALATIALLQFAGGGPISQVAVLLAFALIFTLALGLRDLANALLEIADEQAVANERAERLLETDLEVDARVRDALRHPSMSDTPPRLTPVR